jgi:hypothetical protein
MPPSYIGNETPPRTVTLFMFEDMFPFEGMFPIIDDRFLGIATLDGVGGVKVGNAAPAGLNDGTLGSEVMSKLPVA